MPQNRQTISDLLFPEMSPDIRVRIEHYRREWEELNDPIDLTKYYTCRWPRDEQLALIGSDFNAYLKGLPLFFQHMIADIVGKAVAGDRWEQMPEQFIKIFMASQPRAQDERSRGR